MKKKRNGKKKKTLVHRESPKPKKKLRRSPTPLTLYHETSEIKEHLAKLSQGVSRLHERLEDAEIQINLLTRFITTLCVEKLGMRIGVLKRLLKRIEKEAIRDSQILHLESLYNLPQQHTAKKPSSLPKPPRHDPWDDIS